MGPTAKFLLEHNARQVTHFCSPDETGKRTQYRAKHPTEIAALKCMDGRLNLPVITEIPPGIIQPYRTMGGRFNLGWFYFGHLIEQWYRYAMLQNRDCLVLITYHWSKGDIHRGCRGFNYDTDAAIEHTAALVKQFERVFGENHAVMYPIQVGIETDEDSLIVHGQCNTRLAIAESLTATELDLRAELVRLFPDMKSRILNDLLNLLVQNQNHVAKLRKSPRADLDTAHRENILLVGRGYAWVHLINRAFIVGPYEEEWGTSVATAASLLLENIRAGRVSGSDGVLLVGSGTYRDDVGVEKPRSIEKARRVTSYALDIIKERTPDLMPYMDTMSGIVNLNTQLFTQVSL